MTSVVSRQDGSTDFRPMPPHGCLNHQPLAAQRVDRALEALDLRLELNDAILQRLRLVRLFADALAAAQLVQLALQLAVRALVAPDPVLQDRGLGLVDVNDVVGAGEGGAEVERVLKLRLCDLAVSGWSVGGGGA